MNAKLRTHTCYALLVAALLAAGAWLVRQTDQVRGDQPLQEVLYIPSPKVVKRLSLGYSGLLADIYWTRVVQYFGGKHQAHAMQYKILAPLLDMTTSLDPKLIPAYQFGSVFLAQKPPEGAGDPQAAARLVEKGIAENPQVWRLYYTLGYIEWLELKDPAAAARAFQRGSGIKGAQSWMRVMAAALAAHAGETETAVYMWTNILNSTEDRSLRINAINRLRCLKVDSDVKALQERVDELTKRQGHAPSGWEELISVGLLRGVPIDPRGHPYRLVAGRVQLSDPDEFPFVTRGLPPGKELGDLPGEKGFKKLEKKLQQ
jgi:hypothetical protein